jgi:hypothetical protein
MVSSQESDQTMTSADEVSGEKAAKARSGIFGIIAILSSVVIALVSLTFTVTDSSTTESAIDPYLRVRVTLVSDSFTTQQTGNVCDGTKDLPDIDAAEVLISQGSWKSKISIGRGLLDNQGDCIYTVSLLPISTFSGGKVMLSVSFPFGTSPVTTFDVGNSTPYQVAQVRIAFNS